MRIPSGPHALARSARAGAALGLSIAFVVSAGAPAGAADAERPTVIELFQSQGCSSCPPANAALIEFAARADVLALNFAVDYWDRLGWRDTFAKPEFTARQWAYARAMGRAEVFTPQIVVNGRVDGVGATTSEMGDLAERADRGAAGPEARIEPGAATIGAGAAPPRGADVWLVRYDPRVIEIAVRRGENAGRTLAHKNVVRELILLGRWNGEAERLALPAASISGLADAVLVQASSAGPILAAAKD
ncbi:MAG: DUF1223 domain-containing protein [Roseiarcus sp.]